MSRKFSTLIAAIPPIAGFVLWFFYEINLLYPGASFGAGRWPDFLIWGFGTVTCLGSIPFLYLSSYSDFKNHNKTWLAKIICIYPFFLFGVFFQFGSDLLCFALGTFILSLLVVFTMHIYSMITSASLGVKSCYFVNLLCLLMYYTVLIILQISFNLLHFIKYELRYLLEPLLLR